jgi:hypothetical protein
MARASETEPIVLETRDLELALPTLTRRMVKRAAELGGRVRIEVTIEPSQQPNRRGRGRVDRPADD